MTTKSKKTSSEKSAKLQIHTENILPIIKQWLYSDKDIFVRELVSNACDALSKIERISDDQKLDIDKSELKIQILVDKEKGTIQFVDTGIGMTDKEVEKYIAQIAFSGAEEFMKKYESEKQEDQIIGHFGLGFYSSYMVASSVDIDTLSYQEKAKPAFWSCDGGSEYTLKPGAREARGTTITLHIDKDNKEYLEESRLKEMLVRYCSFLPYPLYLGEEKINKDAPLWLKSPKDCTDQEYLDFYRMLHPMQKDPILWIHLNIDFPFHVKGILYFPKISNDMDFQKSSIQLYCNRIFVSDNCKDLMPDYLTALRGAIDSPDIPLNVSRSTLQMDSTVRSLSAHISKKVADKLKEMHKNNPESFIESFEDFEMILKLGAMQDPKFFDRIEPVLIWKTTKGEAMTAKEYIEKNLAKTDGKIFYAPKDSGQHFVKLYEESGIDVLVSHPFIDVHFIPHLERKLQKDNSNLRFQRIDGELSDSVLDAEEKQEILDSEGKSSSENLASLVKEVMNQEHLTVEAKALQSKEVFGFVSLDEQMRRLRDLMQSTSSERVPDELTAKKTFIVNTNHPLAKKLPALHKKDAGLCKKLVEQMYQLSLISQKEMDSTSFTSFLESTGSLIQELALQLDS